jgi:hypothetical protein
VIYEYGEPWWNDIDKEKHSIRPSESSSGEHRVENIVVETIEKEMLSFAYEVSLSYL